MTKFGPLLRRGCGCDLVFKNDDFCIKNDELCIKSDGFCINNYELCIENGQLSKPYLSDVGPWRSLKPEHVSNFVSKMMGCLNENDGFCIENDEFWKVTAWNPAATLSQLLPGLIGIKTHGLCTKTDEIGTENDEIGTKTDATGTETDEIGTKNDGFY